MMIVEHRKYMRVDDRLVISWRPSDSGELVVDDLRDVMLMTVNREINDMINSLTDKSPDVAQVLLHLNHKLELLSDSSRESHFGPSLVRLNLSRSGVAFEWRSDIEPGQKIRLSMTLPPENHKLTVQAEVLACERMENGRSRIRCRFLPGQDARVEVLGAYLDYTQDMRQPKNRLQAPLPTEHGQDRDSKASAELSAITDYR